MSKKEIKAIRKKTSKPISQMEEMPVVRNGPRPTAPGKIGYEQPGLPVLPIRPVSPPPPERAIQPEQKQEIVQVLLDTWLKFPYLRLGQLVCLAADPTSSFYVEDGILKTALLAFAHEKIRCDSFSQSRSMQCTLEYGHDGDRHFNHLVGVAWRRF